jgi:hypothetical protein
MFEAPNGSGCDAQKGVRVGSFVSVSAAPELQRIVMAVDPTGSTRWCGH